MKGILNVLKGDYELIDASDRPTGHQKGYKYYLDYYGRYEYWDGYIDKVWDLNPDNIVALYNHNKSYFKDEFIKQLSINSDEQEQKYDKTNGDGSSKKYFSDKNTFFASRNNRSDPDLTDFIVVEKSAKLPIEKGWRII